MKSGNVLITGATGGLGRAFAEQYAAAGDSLFLVARRADLLDEIADDLRSRRGVTVEVQVCDLTDRVARRHLLDELVTRRIDVVVNNAGFGDLANIVDADADTLVAMIELNCVALTELTHALVRPMVERGAGRIVNVASTAAFQAIPGFAVYAATKAYVLSMTQALAVEVERHGVQVQALCPGPTASDFWKVANAEHVKILKRSPRQVAATSAAAFESGRVLVVDGRANKLGSEVSRLLPNHTMTSVAGQLFSPSK